MDGWMWRGKKGGSEALGRATQSRLQMCRQQQCGCFGPHQAALGVSPAHVPAPPVNQPNQASGSTAATKPLRPDPQNRMASDRRTPTSPLCQVKPVIVSLIACLRWNWLWGKTHHPFPCTPFFSFSFFLSLSQLCLHACVGVPLKVDDAHQSAAAFRPQRNAARCLCSFSSTTACLPLCSLVSLAPGHSFNSTLFPILHIHSNIHRAHSHNYRFLLDVSVCL